MAGTPFKDWFDKKAARQLAAQIADVAPGFDRRTFVRHATHDLDALELVGRIQQFSDALAKTLPTSIPLALATIIRSLPPTLEDYKTPTHSILQWPLGQFIADHGVPHFDESMAAMLALTQRFSAEFAVRPFVEQRADATFSFLLSQLEHPNPHVRRWCSEGVRPRLPWGKRLRALVADPSPILPIMEALKDDPSPYVRRSVANTLGDIAKDHPELVIELCQRWAKDNAGEDRAWVIKHALRTPIKDGNSGALAAVGFRPPKKLTASLQVANRRVPIGDHVELSAQVHTTAARAQNLMIDFVVHYVRKRDRSSGKVFKWTITRLPAGGSVSLDKRHAMKTTTIRALYPGVHRVELQVNGARVAEASFELTP